jgi:hypothetical protein
VDADRLHFPKNAVARSFKHVDPNTISV